MSDDAEETPPPDDDLPPLPEPELDPEDAPLVTFQSLRRAALWSVGQGALSLVATTLWWLFTMLVEFQSNISWTDLVDMLPPQLLIAFAHGFAAAPVCLVWLHASGVLPTRRAALVAAAKAWAVACVAALVIQISLNYAQEALGGGSPLAGLEGVMTQLSGQDPAEWALSLLWLSLLSIPYALLVFGRLRAWPLLAQIAITSAVSFPLGFGITLLWFLQMDFDPDADMIWRFAVGHGVRTLGSVVAMACGWRLADLLADRLD